MLKKLIIIPAVICAISLSGCTSKPREVTASIPLVNSSQEKPNKQEVPSQYWSFLSDPSETNVEHEKYIIKLAERYTSALGQTCRELIIVEKDQMITPTPVRRTACEITYKTHDDQAQKAWFIEKQIIESSLYVEL